MWQIGGKGGVHWVISLFCLVIHRIFQGAQTWINLQTTPCLPLAFVRVHQVAPSRTVVATFRCSLLLICRPQKDERLSWPSWLTSQRPTFYCCTKEGTNPLGLRGIPLWGLQTGLKCPVRVVTCMPVIYRFRDTTIYWSKMCVFSPFLSTGVSFEALTRGFPWDLGGLVPWRSGRTLVFDWRAFPLLRSTYSWRLTTYVGKRSAIGQSTRPTQPFILSGSTDEY